jgi:hypothetical protein
LPSVTAGLTRVPDSNNLLGRTEPRQSLGPSPGEAQPR